MKGGGSGQGQEGRSWLGAWGGDGGGLMGGKCFTGVVFLSDASIQVIQDITIKIELLVPLI